MTETAFSAPGEWLKGNLHMHTTASDGEYEPQQAVNAYAEQGYDFLAITDHNTVVDLEELDTQGMTLLPGVEIGAMAAELGQPVHVVGIGTREVPELPEGQVPQEQINAVVAVSEVCFIAHPSWSSLTFSDIVDLQGVIGVEVFNTTCHRGVGRGSSEVQWDDCLAWGRQFYGLAVDDAHCHYNDRFGGWVMLKAEDRSPKSIYDALRAGNFYASSGPVLEEVSVGEDSVYVKSSLVGEVMAVCPMPGRGWTTWRDGIEGPPITEVQLRLRPGTNPVRIVVVDARGRRAWSNPIWLGEAHV